MKVALMPELRVRAQRRLEYIALPPPTATNLGAPLQPVLTIPHQCRANSLQASCEACQDAFPLLRR